MISGKECCKRRSEIHGYKKNYLLSTRVHGMYMHSSPPAHNHEHAKLHRHAYLQTKKEEEILANEMNNKVQLAINEIS